ncbi:VOC family protein [Promicromonospora sp. MS192]|uniref:VOC family protein n=1 Tax=Promicromonospora sp. MS192 TaxID=3412684 RepID=UPI003C2B90FB
MATLHDVVFDCRHPASLARFWALALDGYDVAPYDDEELTRLRTLGVHDPEDDPSVLVEAPGRTPRLFFNRVPEPKTVKNRVHLDVRHPDRDAEVARLVAAGATEVGRHEDWVVMTDPEGNEFCVFPA